MNMNISFDPSSVAPLEGPTNTFTSTCTGTGTCRRIRTAAATATGVCSFCSALGGGNHNLVRVDHSRKHDYYWDSPSGSPNRIRLSVNESASASTITKNLSFPSGSGRGSGSPSSAITATSNASSIPRQHRQRTRDQGLYTPNDHNIPPSSDENTYPYPLLHPQCWGTFSARNVSKTITKEGKDIDRDKDKKRNKNEDYSKRQQQKIQIKKCYAALMTPPREVLQRAATAAAAFDTKNAHQPDNPAILGSSDVAYIIVTDDGRRNKTKKRRTTSSTTKSKQKQKSKRRHHGSQKREQIILLNQQPQESSLSPQNVEMNQHLTKNCVRSRLEVGSAIESTSKVQGLIAPALPVGLKVVEARNHDCRPIRNRNKLNTSGTGCTPLTTTTSLTKSSSSSLPVVTTAPKNAHPTLSTTNASRSSAVGGGERGLSSNSHVVRQASPPRYRLFVDGIPSPIYRLFVDGKLFQPSSSPSLHLSLEPKRSTAVIQASCRVSDSITMSGSCTTEDSVLEPSLLAGTSLPQGGSQQLGVAVSSDHLEPGPLLTLAEDGAKDACRGELNLAQSANILQPQSHSLHSGMPVVIDENSTIDLPLGGSYGDSGDDGNNNNNFNYSDGPIMVTLASPSASSSFATMMNMLIASENLDYDGDDDDDDDTESSFWLDITELEKSVEDGAMANARITPEKGVDQDYDGDDDTNTTAVLDVAETEESTVGADSKDDDNVSEPQEENSNPFSGSTLEAESTVWKHADGKGESKKCTISDGVDSDQKRRDVADKTDCLSSNAVPQSKPLSPKSSSPRSPSSTVTQTPLSQIISPLGSPKIPKRASPSAMLPPTIVPDSAYQTEITSVTTYIQSIDCHQESVDSNNSGGNSTPSKWDWLRQHDISALLAKLEESEKKQRKMQKQLKQSGVVIAEDIPYDVTKTQINSIAQRMQAIGSNDVVCADKAEQARLREEYFKLEQDMERYTASYMLSEGYQAEQDALERKWEQEKLLNR